jgi:hypothetical protein
VIADYFIPQERCAAASRQAIDSSGGLFKVLGHDVGLRELYSRRQLVLFVVLS